MLRCVALLVLAPLTVGCGNAIETTGSGGGGGGGGGGAAPVSTACDPGAPASRFISCVVAFHPGPGAGQGQDHFPAVIEGPPVGAGSSQGSMDVLSLGRGGEITVGFGGGAIVDGDGADFVVFENPFLVGGDPTNVFKELGEVSVSEDGETWVTFPCAQGAYPYTGCAGWHPVLSNPDNGLSPFDPAAAGGDPFDLADVGLTRARFLRIRDVSNYGGKPNAGFDLDAAAIIHPASP
jgi:hypothetical protein